MKSHNFFIIDATAKSPKNVAKTTPMLQNQGGKELLTLASLLAQKVAKESNP